MNRPASLLLPCALLCTLAAGCAHHAVAPPPAGVLSERVAQPEAPVVLRTFSLEGLGSRDEAIEVARVRRGLVEHLRARNQFARVSAAEGAPTVNLDVQVVVERETHRTWILDALFAPLGGMLAPWWGRVRARLVADVSVDEAHVAHHERAVERKFRAAWWSWYRRTYVEDAYSLAYGELFAALATDLATDAPALAAALESARRPAAAVAETPEVTPEVAGESAPAATAGAVTAPSPEALVVAPTPATAEAAASAELADPAPGARLELLDPEGPRFGVLRERPRAVTGLWSAVAGGLGGAEAQVLAGVARVSSSARDENGQKVEIAAGRATQTGLGIAIYGAPRTTGFYLGPTLGFMAQEIEIHDFRRTLPDYQVSGGHEIPASCSYPTTGVYFDCSDPNVYDLTMRTTYGGARAGYQLVLGNPWVALFLSGELGVNVLEYRSISARIGIYDGERTGWDFLQSGAAGATLGIELPRAHLAMRISLDYELYREFRYDQPLQFQGAVVFDPAKQTYVRPLRYVSGASLEAWTLQCALALTY